MITQADQKVIDFLKQFKVATTSQLCNFYSSKGYGRARLPRLVNEYGILKRERENAHQEYIYYSKRINRRTLLHDLGLTNFYIEIGKVVTIKKCIVQPKIERIIPDLVLGYHHHCKDHIAFVEYQRSTNPINIDKYLKFYYSDKWKAYFDVFPELIIVSNQHIPKQTEIKVIHIKENLEDINKIKTCG